MAALVALLYTGVIFNHEAWIHRFGHNETALAIEKRLHRAGQTM